VWPVKDAPPPSAEERLRECSRPRFAVGGLSGGCLDALSVRKVRPANHRVTFGSNSPGWPWKRRTPRRSPPPLVWNERARRCGRKRGRSVQVRGVVTPPLGIGRSRPARDVPTERVESLVKPLLRRMTRHFQNPRVLLHAQEYESCTLGHEHRRGSSSRLRVDGRQAPTFGAKGHRTKPERNLDSGHRRAECARRRGNRRRFDGPDESWCCNSRRSGALTQVRWMTLREPSWVVGRIPRTQSNELSGTVGRSAPTSGCRINLVVAESIRAGRAWRLWRVGLRATASRSRNGDETVARCAPHATRDDAPRTRPKTPTRTPPKAYRRRQ